MKRREFASIINAAQREPLVPETKTESINTLSLLGIFDRLRQDHDLPNVADATVNTWWAQHEKGVDAHFQTTKERRQQRIIQMAEEILHNS